MSTTRNRLQTTISNTPGTAGALTISTAQSGYRTFAAGDDGLSFNVLIIEGTAWEVRTGCVYTHSGTSLARGTLEDSSTGSAINLTSAAIVAVTATAGDGRLWNSAALVDQVVGTDANTTMTVNTLYVVDMSAWATADRTYTLPATAAVGDRVGIMISAGDASHELIVTAASGDTLNGVAGGTEWSRLFITGEMVIMRCVAANATWMVECDGRIPQKGLIYLTTAASAEPASTFVRPTDFTGAWTAATDNASIISTSNGEIKTRRAGTFSLSCFGFSGVVLGAAKYFSVALYKNGTTNILFASTLAGSSAVGQQAGAQTEAYSLAADDYVVYQYRSEEGSKGLAASTSPRVLSWASLVEVLP